MRKAIATWWLCALAVCAAAFVPADGTEFSLLVCSPGEHVPTKFGHAALRLRDEAQDVDAVFDYGTFFIDDVAKFAKDFLTGETHYLLDAKPFRYNLMLYAMEGRGMVEYPLNLTWEEKVAVWAFLEENLAPENRVYLYNFFFDNCATRIRDILQKEVAGLRWDEPYGETTWREAIHQYVDPHSWMDLGISLALGSLTDRPASRFQLMFLPDRLQASCERATAGDGRRLAGDVRVLLTPREKPEAPLLANATLVLWLCAALLLGLALWERRRGRAFAAVDVALFLALGIAGAVVWVISFVSIHSFVFPNCTVLWLTPLHAVFAVLWAFPAMRCRLRWYFCFASVMAVVYLVASVAAGQYVSCSVLPLLAMVAVRWAANWRLGSKQ